MHGSPVVEYSYCTTGRTTNYFNWLTIFLTKGCPRCGGFVCVTGMKTRVTNFNWLAGLLIQGSPHFGGYVYLTGRTTRVTIFNHLVDSGLSPLRRLCLNNRQDDTSNFFNWLTIPWFRAVPVVEELSTRQRNSLSRKRWDIVHELRI
jgi:hypothetical protein